MPGMGTFWALKAQEKAATLDLLPRKGTQVEPAGKAQTWLQTFWLEQYSNPAQPPIEQSLLAFNAASLLKAQDSESLGWQVQFFLASQPA